MYQARSNFGMKMNARKTVKRGGERGATACTCPSSPILQGPLTFAHGQSRSRVPCLAQGSALCGHPTTHAQTLPPGGAWRTPGTIPRRASQATLIVRGYTPCTGLQPLGWGRTFVCGVLPRWMADQHVAPCRRVRSNRCRLPCQDKERSREWCHGKHLSVLCNPANVLCGRDGSRLPERDPRVNAGIFW